MSHIMHQKWIGMLKAFQKLSPDERLREMTRRRDEIIEKIARLNNISKGDAYKILIDNKHKIIIRQIRDVTPEQIEIDKALELN